MHPAIVAGRFAFAQQRKRCIGPVFLAFHLEFIQQPGVHAGPCAGIRKAARKQSLQRGQRECRQFFNFSGIPGQDTG